MPTRAVICCLGPCLVQHLRSRFGSQPRSRGTLSGDRVPSPGHGNRILSCCSLCTFRGAAIRGGRFKGLTNMYLLSRPGPREPPTSAGSGGPGPPRFRRTVSGRWPLQSLLAVCIGNFTPARPQKRTQTNPARLPSGTQKKGVSVRFLGPVGPPNRTENRRYRGSKRLQSGQIPFQNEGGDVPHLPGCGGKSPGRLGPKIITQKDSYTHCLALT